MQRVLDIDLDFFVHGVAYLQEEDGRRLDDTEYPAWSVEDALVFLEDRCRLRTPLPGQVVETHGEVFDVWRTAIGAGALTPPFHVTHVDAHADLGLGDTAYRYLMGTLLFEEPERRQHPQTGPHALNDGNYLAFAVACRWLGGLRYVFNDGGGGDLLHFHMADFDHSASHIELKAMRTEEIDRGLYRQPVTVARYEPRVPFEQIHWSEFHAEDPFDFIFLAKSPAFTPASADSIFEEVRVRFIDTQLW